MNSYKKMSTCTQQRLYSIKMVYSRTQLEEIVIFINQEYFNKNTNYHIFLFNHLFDYFLQFFDPDEPRNLFPKTVDEDPTLPSIEVNRTKLLVETFGYPLNPVVIVNDGDMKEITYPY